MTDATTHFDYRWTEEKGGIVSYFAASRKDPVTNPTYELEGHTCVVSSPDSKYGLRMSYDGCIGALDAPSATTVHEYVVASLVLVVAMGYYYNWTSTASEDYQTWESGSPVQNPNYDFAGHTCKTTKVDSHYGVLFESEAACKAAVIPPNSASVTVTTEKSSHNAEYKPFAGKSDASYIVKPEKGDRTTGDSEWWNKINENCWDT